MIMEIIHISAECYPVAKVGGLGDVVGSLPKYQQHAGHIAKVVMPCYKTAFLAENEFELVHQGGMWLGSTWRHFNVIKEKTNKLGFDLYLVDIPGLLDQEGVYGHWNDSERFTAFQIATLDWLNVWAHKPDIIHCHDHHSGLIPFMMTQCYKYDSLKSVPTVFTIHNAQYQGQMGWDKMYWLPAFDPWKTGMMDWQNQINPMAAAIKNAWRVTTVSPGYMEELMFSANGLESLFRQVAAKCIGILNGIDTSVWDPASDKMLSVHYNGKNLVSGKRRNKEIICDVFHFDVRKPLFAFIGRLVTDKGADLLPEIIARAVYETDGNASFLVLGSGDSHITWSLEEMKLHLNSEYNTFIGYNEKLSHLIYAGSDFMLMPSRVEPCGLNQLYSLRYGTMPMVRSTGGLKDTVVDFGDPGGYGIRFNNPSVWDVCYSIGRAVSLYEDPKKLNQLRRKMMKLDFSWIKSAEQYINLYYSLK
jgi:starch synthase